MQVCTHTHGYTQLCDYCFLKASATVRGRAIGNGHLQQPLNVSCDLSVEQMLQLAKDML